MTLRRVSSPGMLDVQNDLGATGRFVRMLATERDGEWGPSISEVEVYAEAKALAAEAEALKPGAPGVIPVGQYKCYSAPGWTATAGGIGSGTFTPGQFGGYMWIFDARHYANMKEEERETYSMQGDAVIPVDSPWKRAKAVLHYRAKGVYGKPTIHLGWEDAPGAGLACTQ